MNLLTATMIKEKAKLIGADLIGVCAAATLEKHPPDAKWPQTPGRIWDECRSVIVLAKHVPAGMFRAQDLTSQSYTPQLVMSKLDVIALELSYWLEEQGVGAFPAPQQHTDMDLKKGTYGPLSLRHLAVEAGLGSLGLNMMLVTPQYGPRVYLTAVLTDAELETDQRTEQLCPGVSCGLCLFACPPNAVEHWGLNKRACSTHAQKYGVSSLLQSIRKVIQLEDVEMKQQHLGRPEMVNYWQALRSGSGAYGGCPSCFQACPVGEDRKRLRKLDLKPDEERRAKRQAMRDAESRGEEIEGLLHSCRWIAPNE